MDVADTCKPPDHYRHTDLRALGGTGSERARPHLSRDVAGESGPNLTEANEGPDFRAAEEC